MAKFYHANHLQWSKYFDRNPVCIPIIFNQLRNCKPVTVAGAPSLLAKEFYVMKNSRFTGGNLLVPLPFHVHLHAKYRHWPLWN